MNGQDEIETGRKIGWSLILNYAPRLKASLSDIQKGYDNMGKTILEGSYFCEKCNKEYNGEGICECGGEIEFISMHSNRYLNIWMKSRKAIGSSDAKNEEKKGKIKEKGETKKTGETDMSLDDKVKKLKELLEQYPEMANPNIFDNELEKRRKLYKEIREEIEVLGNDMEHTWADNAWEKVKNKIGE